MKVRKYKEKESVTLVLTKQEAWDLLMVCHSATVWHEQELREYKKNSEYWNCRKDRLDKARYFENLLTYARITSEIEIVEVN